jgi:protein SCO1/2
VKPRVFLRIRAALSALVLALAVVAAPGRAHAGEDVPKELAGIDIEDKAGAPLPLDVRLRASDGRAVSLRDYVDGKRPVVLVLAYYGCPMLCSLVLNGVLGGMKGIRPSAGPDYRFLVVSFDPRDTSEIAAGKRASYVGAYGRSVDASSFEFFTGEPAEVRRLADAVGFHYRWDASTEQFAHAAGAFVTTGDGRLSRTLYGVTFEPNDLQLALFEASDGKIGGAVGRVLLFCFHYDPSARGYVLASTRIMKASGLVTLAVLAAWLFRFWRMERRRTARARAEQATTT